MPGHGPAHAGHNGAELLGRDAVVALIRQRCGLDAAAVAPRRAGRRFWAGAAVAVDEFGSRLASLVATLRHPATAEAAAGIGERTWWSEKSER